jgi:ribosomal protein S18 acetylase RimI-like enzyme
VRRTWPPHWGAPPEALRAAVGRKAGATPGSGAAEDAMAVDDHEITQAAADDIDSILDLQERNQPERGGTPSARLPREWLEAAVADMPIIVARKEGQVVGYLISASREAYAGVPVVTAMLRAHPGAGRDAYVYGPVCVAEEARGRGVARAMFAALRARLPGRQGVLFIRRDNAASLRAHEKMGMREVARFTQGGAEMAVLAYVG